MSAALLSDDCSLTAALLFPANSIKEYSRLMRAAARLVRLLGVSPANTRGLKRGNRRFLRGDYAFDYAPGMCVVHQVERLIPRYASSEQLVLVTRNESARVTLVASENNGCTVLSVLECPRDRFAPSARGSFRPACPRKDVPNLKFHRASRSSYTNSRLQSRIPDTWVTDIFERLSASDFAYSDDINVRFK